MLKKYLLVTGSEGYIGKHLVRYLRQRNLDVIGLSRNQSSTLTQFHIVGDYGDSELLKRLFNELRVDTVFHLAGTSYPARSIFQPELTYFNNVAKTRTLLEAMCDAGIRRIVFPSSASIFGEAASDLIDESHPLNPQTPYADSKVEIERMLMECHRQLECHYVCLRLFNPAGFREDTCAPARETLLPNLMRALIYQQKFPLHLGYATADGSSIRDYIFIDDICDSFFKAYSYLKKGGRRNTINIGTGHGTSVWELIDHTEKMFEKKIPVTVLPARIGDSARLVANPIYAKKILNWQASTDLPDLLSRTYRAMRRDKLAKLVDLSTGIIK